MHRSAVVLLMLSSLLAAGQKAQKDQQHQNVVYFNVTADSFSATGKWASTSSDPKDQIGPQEVEIDCFKEIHTCVEAEASYYMGNRTFWLSIST